MKTLAYIVGFVALIVIITMGLSRNNNFFNHGHNLGELNYLTPGAAQVPMEGEAKATEATTDSTKAAATTEAGMAAEAKTTEAGQVDKSAASGESHKEAEHKK